jgi:hypothetical protein
MLAKLAADEGERITQQPQPIVTYLLASYYDRAKDVAGVVRSLERLDALGWTLGVRPDWFPNTGTSPEFLAAAAKLERRETAVHRAVTAFKFPQERKVRSEGITHDPVDDVFYFSGDAAKLLRVDRSGNITDFPIEPFGEKMGRLGMDVDARRRQLWAVSAVWDREAPPEVKGRSGISVYDLRDGRLVRRVRHGSTEQQAFFNDLTLLADGTAFVTDSIRNEVLRLRPGAEAFEVFAGGFLGPNGIATSADERTLFVADFEGLTRIDFASGARELLKTSTPLNGIDGLVEHRGSLIGIQNVLGRPRVVRVYPSEGNRVEVLESSNPILNVPATGVVAGTDYYFLANLGEDADGVILRIPLE